jgi:hypothetical protein
MLRRILIGLAAALAAYGQSKTLEKGSNRMELTLERKTDAGWRAVDPGFVFQKNDHLRFRFRTNFEGYLYVMNQGTSGTYSQLFPREDTGTENRVDRETEYVVPATEGSFRVDGPAGYDVLYWVVEPAGRREPGRYRPLPPPPEGSAKVLSGLRPRCDDSILRARGECVDATAGAQAVPGSRRLPENLEAMEPARSRQLVFLKQESQSVVSSPAPLTGPVVYEFRLAHR